MLTLNQIRSMLEDKNVRKVAKACGLHENTVYSLMRSDNPRYSTVKALSDYFEKKQKEDANAV